MDSKLQLLEALSHFMTDEKKIRKWCKQLGIKRKKLKDYHVEIKYKERYFL